MRTIKSILIVFLVLAIVSMSGIDLNGADKKSAKRSGLININTAGVAQLSTLPGIGKKKAERIISYRKKKGRFRKTRDIMKVKGIGEKTYLKFAKKIRV